MSGSILNSIKKNLGVADDYTAFDPDILMHINSVFSTLNQLGVGPVNGFFIEDAVTQWEDFLGVDSRLNHVKSYVTLRVRMLFDPPTTSYLINAMEAQIKELEWRIEVSTSPVPLSAPIIQPDGDVILDGGDPVSASTDSIDGGSPLG